ncbi:multidrug effflux MFS transporter [Aquabacterium sp. NJ1]|uniref:multidrug effflux MFS transporter n=1 Tax=Aquabacterium sp. NJ1 TaxID=1538295 RepID=UPI0009DDA6EF|nr:multidrug effflux MFS transporter [Aquabacterium sp. NJ1]
MSASEAQAASAARSSSPASPPPASHVGGLPDWVIVAALGMLTGLQPVTTDLYLPALPQMQQALGLTTAAAQWTLSVLILSFGIGQLVWGPISDRFGRRPVLRWGLGLYVVSSLAATLANDLPVMLLARVVQGVGLSASVMCGRAMIRDLYAPEQGARMMARGMSGLGVIALLGPILGGLTATYLGWRATMSVLAIFGGVILVFVWLKLPETLPPARRQAHLHWGAMARNWWGIAQHPTFRAHTLLTSSTYGGLYAYLALSSFVFINVLGTSRTLFGVAMASISLSYLGGTILCRHWLPTHGLTGTVRLAGWCSLTGGLLLVIISGWQWLMGHHVPAWTLLPGMWVYAFAHATHQSCGQTGVVSAFPTRAGAASALSGFLLSVTAFVIGTLLSLWTALPGWADTIHPMTLSMGLGGAITAWIALGRVQRHGLSTDDA